MQNAAYVRGDKEIRPWGEYEVLDTGTTEDGQEFCTKRITVKPKKALSLQRHAHRNECWEVEQGTLTVILEDTVHELKTGDSIKIPQKALHCMINNSDVLVLIKETQTGHCREDDIQRLCDSNGRHLGQTQAPNPNDQKSIDLYKTLTEALNK